MPSSTISRPTRAARERRLEAVRERDRRRCAEDPARFIARHVTIEDPDGTVIPFALWPCQRQAISTLVGSELAIVLKARRLGLSWVALSLALWLAIYQQGIRILILCKTESDASELLDRIRRMRDRIREAPGSSHILAGLKQPAKLRDAVTTLDVGSSTIRALVGTPAAARSETAGLVIWDEAAFQRRAGDIWQGLLPTIEGGGRLWIVSTGNGTRGDGETFADLWRRATQGLNDFVHLFLPWSARPDRDDEWKRRQIADLGDEDRFRVEYPEDPDDAFVAAGATHVYSRAGIAAAVRLGREFDERRAQDDMSEPAGGELPVCADFGEQAHTLILWPLEAGGFYVVAEHAFAHSEPDQEASHVVTLLDALGHPMGRFRYDASKPESARLMLRVFRAMRRYRYRKATAVSFGQSLRGKSIKRQSILYLRRLFNRAAEGKATGIIAISPSCVKLIDQLENLQFKDDESEDVVKQDDHGPDALIAGVAPTAQRWVLRREGEAA